MATESTHVRLSPATVAKLRELQALWAEGDLARDWAPAPEGMHVSIDRVIGELIRRDAAHRLAAFRQRGRKRTARAAQLRGADRSGAGGEHTQEG